MALDFYDVFDRDEVNDFLESDEDIADGKFELAQEAADFARSIAPVDTAEYRDEIAAKRDGAGVYVEFGSEISNLVEYGTEDTPEFAVRHRMEAKFGGDFES